jgi:molybdopterin-guanine dinucleotide biosynthesis protein B
VGFSDAGKTTVLEKLIPEFVHRGYRVGTIKHHHGPRLELDKPGKDSWRHKAAGAATAVVCSPTRIGMVRDIDEDPGPEGLLALFPGMDIVLCEGYKTAAYPKVEVFRRQSADRPICLSDPHLLAIIGDRLEQADVPCFSWTDSGRLCEFLIHRLLHPTRQTQAKIRN